MKEFNINKNDAGQRLDKFVTKAVPALPKSMMYKYIRSKRIKVNGRRAEISTRLGEGDRVQMYVNDEFFAGKGENELSFTAMPKEISVVYEDGNILLCDKPSGLVVHEDDRGSTDTLIGRVLRYLYDKGEYDPAGENSFVPALCNRIDRNTSGIVICAKNAEALRVLNQKVRDRELEKRYLCVTVGIPQKKSAELKAYCKKDENEKLVTVRDRPFEGARTMVTRFRVLKENREKDIALLEVGLVTGRTHQIRAHLAHIGCPLLGDGKYGNGRVNRAMGVKTQALCSHKLRFAFTTDAGSLAYLNGREFTAEDPWFLTLFR